MYYYTQTFGNNRNTPYICFNNNALLYNLKYVIMDTKTKIEWALKMLKDQMKNLKNSVSEGEQTPKNTALKLSELLTQIEEIERLNNNV